MKSSLIAVGVIFVVAFIFAAVITGYSFFTSGKIMPEVDAFANDFYDYFNKGDYDHIYSKMGSNEFRRSSDYRTIKRFLEDIQIKYGRALAKKRTAWRLNYKNDVMYCTVRYSVKREKKDTREDMILVKRNGRWGVYYFGMD